MCTLRCFPFVSVWHIYAACNRMVSEFWRFDRERARIYVHLLENEIAICAERSNLRIYTRGSSVQFVQHTWFEREMCAYTYLSVAAQRYIGAGEVIFFSRPRIPRINVSASIWICILAREYECVRFFSAFFISIFLVPFASRNCSGNEMTVPYILAKVSNGSSF